MKDSHNLPNRLSALRSRRLAAGLTAALILATVLLARYEKDSAESLSIELTDVHLALPPDYQPPWAEFSLQNVSTDGRWVYLASHVGPESGCRFFDLRKRRLFHLAGREDFHVGPLPDRNWTPERLLVGVDPDFDSCLRRWLERHFGIVADDSGYTSLWVFNGLTRHARRLANLDPGEMLLSFDAEIAWGGREQNLVAYPVRRSHEGVSLSEYVVHDIQSGKKQRWPEDTFRSKPDNRVGMWGFLGNDSTLVFGEEEFLDPGPQTWRAANLYFLDVTADRPPHRVPIAKRFDQLRAEGALGENAGNVHSIEVMTICEEGRLVRLLATVSSRLSPNDDDADRSSVWNLNIEAGELTKFMDLTLGPVESELCVVSPSGQSLVAALARPRRHSAGPESTTMSLALYTIGRSPRRLPFQLITPGWICGKTGACGFRMGTADILFADENTLVYAAPGYELWQFDLRTWKSQLLWRPGAAGPQTDNEKRTTDNGQLTSNNQ